MKSSLFTHAHSSPLSLAARLHQYYMNHFRYVNNDWTFSGQTLHVQEKVVFIGFTTILSLRHPLGALEYMPLGQGAHPVILFLCLRFSSVFLLKIKFKLLLNMACRSLLNFLNSPPTVPPVHSVPATLTWLFFRQIKPLHTSGPLNVLVLSLIHI